MVHQEQKNDGKASFQPYLQFKRSSKSHPRTDSISSFSSGISRSRSTGRDPRLLDLMNTYKSRNHARDDDTQSVSSQASSMSSWSGIGSYSDVTHQNSYRRVMMTPETVQLDVPTPPSYNRVVSERAFIPIREDENEEAMSIHSSVTSVTSLRSVTGSCRPLSPEVEMQTFSSAQKYYSSV